MIKLYLLPRHVPWQQLVDTIGRVIGDVRWYCLSIGIREQNLFARDAANFPALWDLLGENHEVVCHYI
ncbi:hypothetical protein [Burkholderia sp. LS-044]|uniref:hypothetical protein n=1 Tax=Burkholderia sp. LS-044 TaxID=1459967 RepID=UPI001455FA5E|nr:hypothetical protein [Burkholderia sp. LS-044]